MNLQRRSAQTLDHGYVSPSTIKVRCDAASRRRRDDRNGRNGLFAVVGDDDVHGLPCFFRRRADVIIARHEPAPPTPAVHELAPLAWQEPPQHS